MRPQRSVKGFDVYNALEACSTFRQFGGHICRGTMKKLFHFKEAFEKQVQNDHPDMLIPEIEIDARNRWILP
jgi:single-stranded-DNA-specific exonuclease